MVRWCCDLALIPPSPGSVAEVPRSTLRPKPGFAFPAPPSRHYPTGRQGSRLKRRLTHFLHLFNSVTCVFTLSRAEICNYVLRLNFMKKTANGRQNNTVFDAGPPHCTLLRRPHIVRQFVTAKTVHHLVVRSSEQVWQSVGRRLTRR